jgi:hypothetical protein
LEEGEAREAFLQLHTIEAWRSLDAAIVLAPTDKWWAWWKVEDARQTRVEPLGDD